MTINILKNITTLIFDFDNTFLLLDETAFVQAYATRLSKRFLDIFSNPADFLDNLLAGTKYMLKNQGKHSNVDHFFEYFLTKCPDYTKENIINRFQQFYNNEFNEVSEITKPHPLTKSIIQTAFKKGLTVVIATNPLFPESATRVRLGWIDLAEYYDEFALITDGENSSYAKPSREYYLEILEKIEKKPGECLMVGNDLIFDGAASLVGIKFYYVTGNEHQKDSFLSETSREVIKNEEIVPIHEGPLEDLYNSLIDFNM
ncbi:MAG: HAD family hydrolase [Candidatus Hodarchaeales archaeon]